MAMHVEIIQTTSLGNRGYLIHDGKKAVAVDVQRDHQKWSKVANKLDLEIIFVIETHMHNDYVTGGFKLAKEHGAKYIVPKNSGQTFTALEASDGQEFIAGDLTIRALHTPGHTPHHMSYAISDNKKSIVCTGGGLLYGTVGRTDLISEDMTEELTSSQYDSAHKLKKILPKETDIYPTHGFGSFCSSSDGSGATASTLETETTTNIAFTHDKEAFIDTILKGLGPYPRYYAHMGAMNKSGPDDARQLHVHDYTAEDIADALSSNNSWVLDVRTRRAFATKHPEAAIGIELGNSFATYTGWLIPWNDDITLVGDTEQHIREAYEELTRIGMDQFVSGATSNLAPYFKAAPARGYDVKTFDDLSNVLKGDKKAYVLDVRLPADWQNEHIVGSVNIPLHILMEELESLPKEKPVWVHCASGYRASIAASLIDRSGRTPVLIDDSFEKATLLQLTE